LCVTSLKRTKTNKNSDGIDLCDVIRPVFLQQQYAESDGWRWTQRIMLLTIVLKLIRETRNMSFEVFEKLESKVQQAIDTITLLQMEIDELKDKNGALSQELETAKSGTDSLVRENEQLKQEQQAWQERLRTLLGKMEEV